MSLPGEGRDAVAPLFHSASSAPSPSHPLPPLPSSSSVAAIGRECAKCLSYLTRALDGGGGPVGTIMSSSSTAAAAASSRPATLLRALGVISPIHETNNEESSETDNYDDKNNDNNNRGGSKNISNNGNKFYELTPNGRGVMIRLENNHAKKNNNTAKKISKGCASSNKEHDLQGRESTVGASKNDVQRQSEQQQPIPHLIQRKLSNAASHHTNNAQGSRHGEGVLTTSPLSASPSPTAAHAAQCHSSAKDSSSFTTITIECSPCGSDTRAEACARAYVRGPDPLGIVLCSNRLSSQREIEEVLVHELVHIYDVHVRQMDLRDCKQLAYSEVRAAREAECGNRMTSFTTNICAKDRAIVATRNIFPDEGKTCVCDVFEAAVKDHAPFLVGDTSGGGSGIPIRIKSRSSSTRVPSATFSSAPVPPFPPRQSDR